MNYTDADYIRIETARALMQSFNPGTPTAELCAKTAAQATLTLFRELGLDDGKIGSQGEPGVNMCGLSSDEEVRKYTDLFVQGDRLHHSATVTLHRGTPLHIDLSDLLPVAVSTALRGIHVQLPGGGDHTRLYVPAEPRTAQGGVNPADLEVVDVDSVDVTDRVFLIRLDDGQMLGDEQGRPALYSKRLNAQAVADEIAGATVDELPVL